MWRESAGLEQPPTVSPWSGALRGLKVLSLCPQESQEQGLQQKLLDDQFAVLRSAAAEAEAILQDAVSKLDDPLHLRCTSSPGVCTRASGVAHPAGRLAPVTHS